MSWQLFDRIRAFARNSNLYQQERIFQDQSSLDRVVAGGEFLNFNQQQALLDQTNLQINRLERYKDYDQMDETGVISLALDLYADEASLVDPERKHTIVIKAKSRRVKEILNELFFDALFIDSCVRPMVRYLCKYGDSPFEIVPCTDRTGVGSLKFMNVYNFTRVETKLGDLVGFFYQDEPMNEPTFLHPWQVMHLRLTDYGNIYHPYGKCQDINAPVWVPTGYRRMKDLKPGDTVFSWDGCKAIPTKVVKFVSSGTKRVLEIKTKHRCLRVTPEHPVLAIVKDNYIQTKFGPKRDVTTQQYVLAKDLKKWDKLILPKPVIGCEQISIDIHHITKHAGKRLNIPQFVDANFAKLMGFAIGDGWIPVHHPNTVCFAEGVDTSINQKYIDIIASFGSLSPKHIVKPSKQYGYFKYCSAELSRTLFNMGLKGRAWQKRVPEWVYSATDAVKLAFIEGLVDADGSTNVDEWGCERYQLEVSSQELADGVKVLLDQMGYKCGNVSRRNGRKPVAIFDGTEYERRESYIVYWYDSRLPDGNLTHRGNRRTKYDNTSNEFLVESILSIEDGGEIEVGDIQVESEHHNFITNGVVIHNSILEGGRKAFKQLRLVEDAALIYRITRAPEKRLFTIPVGNIPNKEIPEYMEKIARTFKNNRFYDPRTGSFNERFSPLIQEDDFFLPSRPDGSGPKIDMLKGADNLGKIEDIEYFKKNMVAPLKIPLKRVGIGEGAGETEEKSLASSHVEFAKAVQWVQREIIAGLTKVAICHLAMKGCAVSEIKEFELSMSATNAIDELYRMETWSSRTSVMGDLKDLGWFPKQWIVNRFTDLSQDEIEELEHMQAEASNEADEMGLGDGGGGGGLLGGDMGDMGGSDMGGMGGMDAGGENAGQPGADGINVDAGAEGAGDVGDVGGGAEGAGIPMPEMPKSEGRIRGYNYDAEKRVLNEIKLNNKIAAIKRSTNRMNRLNDKREDIRNNFGILVENNELAGLPSKSENAFESCVPKDTEQQVLTEYKSVLMSKPIDETNNI